MSHSPDTPEIDVPLELLAEEERAQQEGEQPEQPTLAVDEMRDEYHDSIRELTGGDNAAEWAYFNRPFTQPRGPWRYEHRMPTK